MNFRTFLVIISTTICFSSCSPKHYVSIVAHRGYWDCPQGGYSHNSIASLKAACEKGFWGAEFDVNMTADGVLLVFHDNKIDGKVINYTNKKEFDYYRLPNNETIPTLDEYLTVAKRYPKTKLVFELKEHLSDELENRAVAASVEALKRQNLFHPSRVMFISFSLSECRKLAEAAPGFTVQYLEKDQTMDVLKQNKVNGIDLQFKAFLNRPSWIKEARENNFSINSWTVNKEEDIKAVLNLDIDQITTNAPELVRSVIKQSKNLKERKATK